jgi:hypothetical protein
MVGKKIGMVSFGNFIIQPILFPLILYKVRELTVSLR